MPRDIAALEALMTSVSSAAFPETPPVLFEPGCYIPVDYRDGTGLRTTRMVWAYDDGRFVSFPHPALNEVSDDA